MCTYLYNILLQARATTMMPSKIGLGAILTMIFAPKVELRVDRTVQRYTGCLVGLGHHAEDHQDNLPKAYAYESPGLTSYNADHDMELTFDSEISNYDIELIQKIRFLMNNAFSIDPRKGQGFKKISAENEIIKVKKIPRYLFENIDCLIAHFHIHTYIFFRFKTISKKTWTDFSTSPDIRNRRSSPRTNTNGGNTWLENQR